MENWFVALTNPNCHRRAELGLSCAGYRSFWPKYRKWACHARTRIAKEYPILGRYLFVEIEDDSFGQVRTIDGVRGFLIDESGRPARVNEAVVFDFMRRYMAGEWDFVAKEEIPDGAKIRVMEGEFANLVTIVRGFQNNKIKILPPGKREFVFTRRENVRAA